MPAMPLRTTSREIYFSEPACINSRLQCTLLFWRKPCAFSLYTLFCRIQRALLLLRGDNFLTLALGFLLFYQRSISYPLWCVMLMIANSRGSWATAEYLILFSASIKDSSILCRSFWVRLAVCAFILSNSCRDNPEFCKFKKSGSILKSNSCRK